MMINELKDKQGNVHLQLTIVSLSEPKTWVRDLASGIVRYAQCEDAAGDKAELSIWDDDVKLFDVGDKVKLINGYCKFYEDSTVGFKVQLTAGIFGRLEKIGELKGDEEK